MDLESGTCGIVVRIGVDPGEDNPRGIIASALRDISRRVKAGKPFTLHRQGCGVAYDVREVGNIDEGIAWDEKP